MPYHARLPCVFISLSVHPALIHRLRWFDRLTFQQSKCLPGRTIFYVQTQLTTLGDRQATHAGSWYTSDGAQGFSAIHAIH